ncbi:hypothetical protein SAY87_024034 [Trapa incisa]|uniref:Uncharacterized protein n=1 Tax=Trapa incisa TaxID=236973 RepID=A0AAN7QUU3_9MYRT|nr:hypothetical protein SAY87_024034 [Trapa incisa]
MYVDFTGVTFKRPSKALFNPEKGKNPNPPPFKKNKKGQLRRRNQNQPPPSGPPHLIPQPTNFTLSHSLSLCSPASGNHRQRAGSDDDLTWLDPPAAAAELH